MNTTPYDNTPPQMMAGRMFQYDTDRLPKQVNVARGRPAHHSVCVPYVFRTSALGEVAEVLYKLGGIAFYIQTDADGSRFSELLPLMFIVSRGGERLSFKPVYEQPGSFIWKSMFYGNDAELERQTAKMFENGAQFWYWNYPEPVRVAIDIPKIPPFSSAAELKMRMQLRGYEV